MNLAFFAFSSWSEKLILNVITAFFFLSYENHAMDDSNNNIIIRQSLLGYLASEATCTGNISSG